MRRALSPLLLLLAAAGCDKTRVRPPEVDAGPVCEATERLVNGQCRFVCRRDGDCAADQRCNLLSGTCEPKPPEPDASVFVPCTEGARRCSVNGGAVELCGADGRFTTETTCPMPDGFCSNERCLDCRPNSTKCSATPTTLEVCQGDGSGYRTVMCAGMATCTMGECRECTAGERRCSPDGKAVQECQRRTQLNLSTTWVNVGDNFDGTCITQRCMGTAAQSACVTPACIPGSSQCMGSATLQSCNATGSYDNITCTTVPGLGPTAECQNGACVDECGEAVREKSYFGCEYWTAVLDNPVVAAVFKGNVLTGQGAQNNDSEFAFVVTNRSTLTATVAVTRFFGGVTQVVKSVTVPGRLDPMSRGLAVIRVPWQSVGDHPVMANGFDSASQSGLRRYGYRLTSTRPITVYQFNPLAAFRDTGSCASANSCTFAVPETANPSCINSVCRHFAYSNDASLLLPAHILGTSYVALTPEHTIDRATDSPGSAATIAFNGMITIVGTQDNTVVTLRSNARTRPGSGVTAVDRGETRAFTINAYDVLQLASDVPVNSGAAANVECVPNPFLLRRGSCSVGGLCGLIVPCCPLTCRVDNDLTGSIVTSDKPIAMFGGSACTNRSVNDVACDHVEEQLFPFVTWGRNFVANRTAPLRLVSNAFASAASAGPDFYKIVAGCPASACPNGTLLTLTPPPLAADVLLPNRCLPGTSLAANNCRLAGGAFVEFRSKTSFTITADQPISAAQLFSSQSATVGTGQSAPAQGDPSLVLLPPIEQWRSQYTVLTAPGTRDNYLGLVIDASRVQEVRVNGTAVPMTSFAAVGSTSFRVANVPVPVGTHTILVIPIPGQMTLPGAGVTVYGFDSFVSYGYTGGLDLTTIVTGINPGG
ncbi:MAG: IgGFc-binding protein [Myxococcales bacterium]|nr:IgGFc-binding protein [Myxococcales bacterium]MDP3503898.1 IgGFc-binding protein [Myxococcales bacterium]